MEDFLRWSKSQLDRLSEFESVHIFLGNQAMDLDSTVASLVYAFYSYQVGEKEKVAYIPVINIEERDFRLRGSAEYVLGQHGITADILVFRDTLDLHQLQKNHRVQLHLLDHNVLAAADRPLEGCVVNVIDHHKRERSHDQGVSMVIETVGSCCTLVAEKVTKDSRFIMDATVAELLYGAIIVDTICLSPSAGKTTPKDQEMITQLEKIVPNPDRRLLFDTLDKKNRDISGLSTTELLRKDLKVVSSSNLTVAISSLPMDLADFVKRPGLLGDMAEFALSQKAELVVLMTLHISEDNKPVRELSVYSKSAIYRRQVSEILQFVTDPSLEMTPFDLEPDLETTLSAFHQGNAKASRKLVLPLIQSFLSGERSPSTPGITPSEESGLSSSQLYSTFDVSSDNSLLNSPEVPDASLSEAAPTNMAADNDVFDPFATVIPSSESLDFAASVAENAEDSQNLLGEKISKNSAEETDPFPDRLAQDGGEKITKNSDLLFDPFASLIGDNPVISSENPDASVTENVDVSPDRITQDVGEKITKNADLLFDPFASLIECDPSSENLDIGASTADSSHDHLAQDGGEKTTKNTDLLFDPFASLIDGDSLQQRNSSEENTAESSDGRSPSELITSEILANQNAGEINPFAFVRTGTSPQKVSTPIFDPFDNVHDEGTEKRDQMGEKDIMQDFDPFSTIDDLDPTNPSLLSVKQMSLPGSSGASSEVSPDSSGKIPGTPQNSCVDSESEFDNYASQYNLPSFNSSEMVRKIQEKKAALSEALDGIGGENGNEPEHDPFTPPNSFSDENFENFAKGLSKDKSLPSFHSAEMTKRLKDRKEMFDDYGENDKPMDVENNEDEENFPFTPTNSVQNNSFDEYMKSSQDLPSFNNAEMVEKIRDKKAKLSVDADDDVDADGLEINDEKEAGYGSCPFTPRNSVVDGVLDDYMKRQVLPSFDSDEMVEKIRRKKSEIADDDDLMEETGHLEKYPFTPRNSLAGGKSDCTSPLDDLSTNQIEELVRAKQRSDGNTSPSVEIGHDSGFRDITDLETPTALTGNVAAYQIAKDLTNNCEKNDSEGSGTGNWKDVRPSSMEKEMAYEITQSLIGTALDDFNPELETAQNTQENAHEEPNLIRPTKPDPLNLVDSVEIETEYLSDIDPLGGNMGLADTPKELNFSTNAEKDLVESTSFNQQEMEKSGSDQFDPTKDAGGDSILHETSESLGTSDIHGGGDTSDTLNLTEMVSLDETNKSENTRSIVVNSEKELLTSGISASSADGSYVLSEAELTPERGNHGALSEGGEKVPSTPGVDRRKESPPMAESTPIRANPSSVSDPLKTSTPEAGQQNRPSWPANTATNKSGHSPDETSALEEQAAAIVETAMKSAQEIVIGEERSSQGQGEMSSQGERSSQGHDERSSLGYDERSLQGEISSQGQGERSSQGQIERSTSEISGEDTRMGDVSSEEILAGNLKSTTSNDDDLKIQSESRDADVSHSLDEGNVFSPDIRYDAGSKKEYYYTTAGRISLTMDSMDTTSSPQRTASTSRPDEPAVLDVTQEIRTKNLKVAPPGDPGLTNQALTTNDVTIDLASQLLLSKRDKMKELKQKENEIRTAPKGIPDKIAKELGVSPHTSDNEEEDIKKPERPTTLQTSLKRKKIIPSVDLMKDTDTEQISSPSGSEGDILANVDNVRTPDDLNTPDALNDSVFEGELEWDNDTPGSTPVEPIPEYTAREEFEDEKNWRSVNIGDKTYRIDMKVIEPYKKVLSHGGYYGDGHNAIIVFCACYLPDRGRRDYHYVMDHLFLYVVSTLELLVVEDYMIVYFHGSTPSNRMPSLRWLKRCYDMIDRRLKKNLKNLLLVHPTIWLKTVVIMTKPFVSHKFGHKLRYIRNLQELERTIPTEYMFYPDEVVRYDTRHSRSSSASPSPT